LDYHLLGKTGLSVSEIGFGGAPAGLRNYLADWNPDDEREWEQIIHAIQRAVEMGINYFDTAPAYGDGSSEKMFGQALRPYRKDIFIATKTFGENADEVLESVEASLERLQTDTIDVLQYHGDWYTDAKVDNILSSEGPLAGMIKAQEQKLVRFIGFTTEGVNGPASRLLSSECFDVIQVCYNLIYQHPYDPSRKSGIFYDAEKLGTGIATMRPLTSGIFQKWLHKLDPGFGDRVDINQALLSFVLSNPLVDVALVGMRSADEVEMNVSTVENQSFQLNLDELHNRYV